MEWSTKKERQKYGFEKCHFCNMHDTKLVMWLQDKSVYKGAGNNVELFRTNIQYIMLDFAWDCVITFLVLKCLQKVALCLLWEHQANII